MVLCLFCPGVAACQSCLAGCLYLDLCKDGASRTITTLRFEDFREVAVAHFLLSLAGARRLRANQIPTFLLGINITGTGQMKGVKSL